MTPVRFEYLWTIILKEEKTYANSTAIAHWRAAKPPP